MAKTTNQKYIESTNNTLADIRFRPKSFALDMITQPPAIQQRYLDSFAQYVYTMVEHLERHYVPMGMKSVAYMCRDMKQIIQEHFENDEKGLEIREYEG